MIARATGLAESTVRLGKHELGERDPSQKPVGERRVRRSGGGRKALAQKDSKLAAKLEDLVEPTTRGHPATCLRWTLKSTRRLAEELTAQGHPISHTAVGQLLDELRYSLQGTRKTLEGGNHPDRNAQFEYIAQRVSEYQGRGQPVISVDTKKKELVGDFTNSGKEFRPKVSAAKRKWANSGSLKFRFLAVDFLPSLRTELYFLLQASSSFGLFLATGPQNGNSRFRL